MSVNKRIKIDTLNTVNVSTLYVSPEIVDGYVANSFNSYDNYVLKYKKTNEKDISAHYAIDVSSYPIIEIMPNEGEVRVDYNGQEIVARLVHSVEYTFDVVNTNGEGIYVQGDTKQIGLFLTDARLFTEVEILKNQRDILLDNLGQEVKAEFMYSVTGSIFGPPYFEDVVQWLRGDTFELEGTTYMRDYSGNDYHAVVIDPSTIQQQITSTDLYTADLQQNGYWYTDASTPNNITLGDLNYEVYDNEPYHGVTFANITAGTFKDIITYATPKDDYQKADVLRFVDGNELLIDVNGNPLLDENGNSIYVRKV